MIGGILLGDRPVLARMPEIPCVFEVTDVKCEYSIYRDDDDEFLNLGNMDVVVGILQLCCICTC